MHDRRFELAQVDDIAGAFLGHGCGGGRSRLEQRIAIQTVGVRVAERGPLSDSDARSPVRTGRDLLDPAVVQPDRNPETVLDEQLGERTTARAGGAQDLLHQIAIEHSAMLAAGLVSTRGPGGSRESAW